jgi:hypothetical protein
VRLHAVKPATVHDIDPPHVHEDTPLDCPLEVRAAAYAGIFRWAAETFRAMARDDWEPVKWRDRWERVAPGSKCFLGDGRVVEADEWVKSQIFVGSNLNEQQLQDRCGKWMMEASRLGLLHGVPELRDLITWHSIPMPANASVRQAMYLRCPSNLFGDLRGGGVVRGTVSVLPDGKQIIDVEKDQRGHAKEFGGLLPRLIPGFLDLPKHERNALTCEWLANVLTADVNRSSKLIEDGGVKTDISSSILKPAYPSPDTHERDEWIFQQRQHGRNWRTILSDLKQLASDKNWEPLYSENAGRQAVKRIAYHHGRNIPKVKTGRPRKTPQTPQ